MSMALGKLNPIKECTYVELYDFGRSVGIVYARVRRSELGLEDRNDEFRRTTAY